jgi:hypothetical protein
MVTYCHSSVDRHRLVSGLTTAVVVCVCSLVPLAGSASAAAGSVSLTLSPTSISPPGTVTATVTIDSVPIDDTLLFVVSGAQAQIGTPTLVSGQWIPSCVGHGTNKLDCPYTGGLYPLELNVPITVPSGVPPTSWTVTATETDFNAFAQATLTIEGQPPPTTTTTTTTVPSTTTTVPPSMPPTEPPSTTSGSASPSGASPTSSLNSGEAQLAATGVNIDQLGFTAAALVITGLAILYIRRPRTWAIWRPRPKRVRVQ